MEEERPADMYAPFPRRRCHRFQTDRQAAKNADVEYFRVCFLSQNVEFTFVLCYSMQQKHLEKFGYSTDRRGKFSNGTGVSEAECLRRASGAA